MSHATVSARVLLFTTLMTAASAVPAAGSVAVTSFDIPGATNYFVSAINDEGVIAGSWSGDGGTTYVGFIRSPRGHITTPLIDPNDTEVYTVLRAINDRGVIAGFYEGQTVPGHGLLLAEGVFTTFDVPGAAGGTALRGINNHGDLAGTFSTTTTPLDAAQFGFIVPHKGAPIIFQLPDPAASGLVVGKINDSRTVVGYYTTAASTQVGFVRHLDGSFVDIVVPGADTTLVYSINDCGIVVGVYGVGDAAHGFYGRPGKLVTFDVPGAGTTFAQGINNRGQLVGRYGLSGQHVFVTEALPGASCDE